MPFPQSESFIEVGENLKYSRSPTTLKANNDYTSILGIVIKKNSTRGPKHGQSERQIMFFKAKEMLKTARKEKHGSHPTILSRWYEQEKYRDSLAKHDIGEKSCSSIASLLKDTTIQLRELNGCRTPNIGYFVWLMGPKSIFDSEKDDAHLAEKQQSLRPIRPEHQQRQRQDQQFY